MSRRNSSVFVNNSSFLELPGSWGLGYSSGIQLTNGCCALYRLIHPDVAASPCSVQMCHCFVLSHNLRHWNSRKKVNKLWEASQADFDKWRQTKGAKGNPATMPLHADLYSLQSGLPSISHWSVSHVKSWPLKSCWKLMALISLNTLWHLNEGSTIRSLLGTSTRLLLITDDFWHIAQNKWSSLQ